MPLPTYFAPRFDPTDGSMLSINPALVADWLTQFLRYELVRRRNMSAAVLGLSGGVDSAVVAYLAARAIGPENVHALRLPYRTSSPESLAHAQLVVDDLGLSCRTVEITAMVEGFVAAADPEISARRLGNVCARCRMIALFDHSAQLNTVPLGTGNKTERFFGYFTWHADDSPPINPLGDLFKTQVWELARYLGVPAAIIDKPPSADLAQGQTDEGDFGISILEADRILHYLALGYGKDKLMDMGFPAAQVDLVWQKVASTHWKRRPPTTAMLFPSAIGDYYLRPVDY